MDRLTVNSVCTVYMHNVYTCTVYMYNVYTCTVYMHNVYTCTDTEMPAYSLIPPTPDSSGHHGNKPLLVSRKTTAVATMATSAGGQRSEVARQISYLLSPSSPLVGENLKVSAPPREPHLTALPPPHRPLTTSPPSHHLTALSPPHCPLTGCAGAAGSCGLWRSVCCPAETADVSTSCSRQTTSLQVPTLLACSEPTHTASLPALPILCSILPVALGNTFFGSACREWQDHLALGLHGNGGGRCRGDKKGRNHDVGWKDNFFESQWGERSAMTTLAPPQDNRMLLQCHALYVTHAVTCPVLCAD